MLTVAVLVDGDLPPQVLSLLQPLPVLLPGLPSIYIHPSSHQLSHLQILMLPPRCSTSGMVVSLGHNVSFPPSIALHVSLKVIFTFQKGFGKHLFYCCVERSSLIPFTLSGFELVWLRGVWHAVWDKEWMGINSTLFALVTVGRRKKELLGRPVLKRPEESGREDSIVQENPQRYKAED